MPPSSLKLGSTWVVCGKGHVPFAVSSGKKHFYPFYRYSMGPSAVLDGCGEKKIYFFIPRGSKSGLSIYE